MKKHLKYACSRYLVWLDIFAVIIGIVAVLPLCFPVSIVAVVICFIAPFVIPFIGSFRITKYDLREIGKSKISYTFGDLFEQECIVITTNIYFDVEPDGKYISSDSLLGHFVKKYYSDDIDSLKIQIKDKLKSDENGYIEKQEYGKTISINKDGKIIYFMAFTDRQKSNQPEDFYIRAIRRFLQTLSEENHGKVVSVPLFGSNNNLSNTGFSERGIALEAFITMLNEFSIMNQRSELKINIVSLDSERAEVIDYIAKYL